MLQPKIFEIISCLDLRAARSSGVQTPCLKFAFYINSLQVFCWHLANSTAADKNILLKSIKIIRAKRFTRKATFHITLGSVNHHYFANSGVFVYCWPQKLNPSMEIAGFLDKPYPHAGLQPDFWDDCPQGDGAFSCLLIRADNLIRVRRLREIHRVTFIGSKSDWCYVWTLKKKKNKQRNFNCILC